MGTLNARLALKHDSDANWALVADTFVPLAGEFIYYDTSKKFKIGDGTTTVGNLAFYGGDSGVSDYNDLTNVPIYLSQPTYTQADSIGSGTFMGVQYTKVDTKNYSMSELAGAVITYTSSGDDVELALDSNNTVEMASTISAMGFAGTTCIIVTPSGNWQSMDEIMITLDADWTLAAYGIALTAGTYIAQTVTEFAFAESTVINPKYAGNFLPAVTKDDDGKEMKVVGGKFMLGAESIIAGMSNIANIRRMLFKGTAEDALPYWSQIRAYHDEFGEIIFDVVDHDTVNKKLTMMMADMIQIGEFDATEALCYCPSGLAAGTYYIDATSLGTWSVNQKLWSWTLTEDIPADGVLVFDLDVADWQIGSNISSYASVSATTPIESVALSNTQDGTDITTVLAASCFNHFDRAVYGSGNYAQSGLHKWLTGTGTGWWTASTPWDRPPSYVNRKGFLSGFSEEFLDALDLGSHICATNHVFENGYNTDDSYTVSAKFFLPSITELCGSTNGYGAGVAEGTQFGAFTDFDDVWNDQNEYEPLIKYAAGLLWYYWERSCYSGYPEGAWYVVDDGYPRGSSHAAYPFRGFAAACTIKSIY